MIKLLRQLEKNPLSLEKISELFPRLNATIYDDLPALPNIDDLLKGRDAACIYYTMHQNNRPQVGHFSLIMKSGNQYEYFSSYGFPPEMEISLTHSNPGKLKHAFKNTKLIINRTRFQSIKNTDTCGRWVILRYLLRNLELKKFAALFTSKITLNTKDDIATIATLALTLGQK